MVPLLFFHKHTSLLNRFQSKSFDKFRHGTPDSVVFCLFLLLSPALYKLGATELLSFFTSFPDFSIIRQVCRTMVSFFFTNFLVPPILRLVSRKGVTFLFY